MGTRVRSAICRANPQNFPDLSVRVLDNATRSLWIVPGARIAQRSRWRVSKDEPCVSAASPPTITNSIPASLSRLSICRKFCIAGHPRRFQRKGEIERIVMLLPALRDAQLEVRIEQVEVDPRTSGLVENLLRRTHDAIRPCSLLMGKAGA